MATHRIRARPARGEFRRPATLRGDDVAAHLRDAASTAGGHAPSVSFPQTEAEVAFLLRDSSALLPIGAQSSLTGAATPLGECILSTARLNSILGWSTGSVRAQAGVALLTLEEELRARRLFYPPVPTFRGAFLGGVAATNAAGAATFKYGSTRDWVLGLSVILVSGDVLDLARGEVLAHAEGYFEIALTSGETRRVPVPRISMPQVAKRSAGYYAEPEMDLVDLFIGSEGTLGVITDVEVRLIDEPCRLLGWTVFKTEAAAFATIGRIRQASRETVASGDPRGIDVAAIETMDRRCLDLLREDGKDREHGLPLPPEADTAVLFEAHLPPGTDADAAMREIGSLDEPASPDTPLLRLCLLLREHDALDCLELALPSDNRRAAQLEAMREAVPLGVNDRIARIQRDVDPGVHKVAADMIVPFERLPEMLAIYRAGFARRGLDHAIWGHASDGNLHVNALPRSAQDVLSAEEALLEFGQHVIRLRGCPLSEHGVGRNRVKQQLLRMLYGDAGIEEMRRTRQALDPERKLSPGVLFTD